ncbi:MAG: hypothetical protein B6D56_08045, partial [Candidatus Omnitrophica bacterium 4484_70.1]
MSNFREKVWVKLFSCFISLLERILKERQKRENLLNRLRLLLLPEASAKEIEGFYSPYGIKIESANPYTFTPLKIKDYSYNDTVKGFNDTVTRVAKNDTVGGEKIVAKNTVSSNNQSTKNPSSLITRLAGFLNECLNNCWRFLLSVVGLNVNNSETERDGSVSSPTPIQKMGEKGTVSLPTLTQKMGEKGYRLFEPKNKVSSDIKEGDMLVIDEGRRNEEGKTILHIVKVIEVNGGKIKYEDEKGGKVRPQEISIEELKSKIRYMYSQEARKGWSEVSAVSSDIFIGGASSDKIPTGTAYRPQEEKFERGDSDFSLSSQGALEGIRD